MIQRLPNDDNHEIYDATGSIEKIIFVWYIRLVSDIDIQGNESSA